MTQPSAHDYIAEVKSLPCVLCGLLGQRQTGRTEAHHARAGQGASQRANDFLVAALCGEGCHRGPLGIHGDRTLLRIAKVEELDLVALTIEAVFRKCEP